MPGRAPGVPEDSAAALPKVAAPGRDGLLADIRGGARLKKVSDTEKKDRSQAMVPGSEAAAAAPSSSAGGGGGGGADAAQGGLAGALASALAARKSKVSHSGEYMCLPDASLSLSSLPFPSLCECDVSVVCGLWTVTNLGVNRR
jgi:Wiskott-Aldrich syndrome protein